MQGRSERAVSRRDLLVRTSIGAGWVLAAASSAAESPLGDDVVGGVCAFIRRCAREDGSYAPSPDPTYMGNSDTGMSDLAAVTYAALLCETFGWELPQAERSVEFIHRHQKKDGRFVNLGGSMKADDPLAVLYNTTQAAVALRALGQRPKIDPSPVMTRFFEGDAYRKLPWYTTSFFPLFYASVDKPFPEKFRDALADYLTSHQQPDGYVQDHVAATFHLAHFFRLIDRPVPRARQMVDRVLHDQKPTGGWDIKQPDWDVHSCFDAMFILRQLGGERSDVRDALHRGGRWALGCRNDDGGFGHYPGRHSDMDAVYFNFGAMIQAGMVDGVRKNLPDSRIMGWGHVMPPAR